MLVSSRAGSGRGVIKLSYIMKGTCPFGQVPFFNIEQVITRLLSSLTNDIPHPSKVQIKIANLDKEQKQLYQRVLE